MNETLWGAIIMVYEHSLCFPLKFQNNFSQAMSMDYWWSTRSIYPNKFAWRHHFRGVSRDAQSCQHLCCWLTSVTSQGRNIHWFHVHPYWCISVAFPQVCWIIQTWESRKMGKLGRGGWRAALSGGDKGLMSLRYSFLNNPPEGFIWKMTSLFLPVAGAGWGHCLCSGWYRKGGYLGMEES